MPRKSRTSTDAHADLTFAEWRQKVLAAGPGAGEVTDAHDDEGDGQAEGEEGSAGSAGSTDTAAGENQVDERLDARLGGSGWRQGRRRRGGRQSFAFMKPARR